MYRSIGLLLLAALTSPAYADDAPVPASPLPAQWSTSKKLALVEGLVVFNAGVAAASPQLYGGFLMVATPLACIEGSGPQHQHLASDWVSCGGYATIGAYDAGIDDPQYSRPRVFAGNFVALNLTIGAAMLAQRFAGDAAAQKLVQHLSIAPQAHGGVHLAYHWAF
ncbi:MAG: hypothetical protein ACHQAU_06905 [Gammaproteobacteria bacterium]